VAAKIAELKNLPVDRIAAASSGNFRRLFNLLGDETRAEH
jgi:Tat protein secretion system quality control protein TatD with DNase activity